MSTNPATGEPWATDFPILTVTDMVRAQLRLLDHLGIERLHAAIGASLGGMQSLAIAAEAPDRVARLVSISAALRAYPQSIALRFVQRQAVMADPDWRGGRYYGQSFPHRGQRIAREIGTITYRSGPEWQERFGRERADDAAPPRLDEDFQVERYLAYQGDKFCLQYDANSYLYISKAMDLFDLLEEQEDGSRPLERIRCPALVNRNGMPFRIRVRPSTDGSRANARAQRPKLMTVTTPSPGSRLSSDVNTRPATAFTPSRQK